jgi:multidrug efflux pump subunit AcrA (membrane-fusion protein)
MNTIQKRLLAIGIGAAVLLSAILLVACGASATPTSATTPTALPAVNSGNQVIADGKVLPLQSANLSFTVGGTVEKVLLTEGDAVAADQVIARLTGSEQAQAGVTAAQLELLNAKKALADLTRDAPIAAAQAKLDLANAKKALDDATTNYNNIVVDYEKGALNEAKQTLADARVRYAYVQQHHEDGMMGQLQIQEAYNDVLRAMQLEQEAAMDYSNRYGSGRAVPSRSSVEIVSAQFDLAEAKRKADEDTTGRLKNGVDPELLAIAEARQLNAERQADAAQKALNNLELRAPFASTLVGLSLKERDFVSPGMVVAHIADLSGWKIETTNLSEMDVVKIAPGDTAAVTFDALPGTKLTGHVDKINGFGESQQGEITYKATILLDTVDSQLHWNMTAIVKIH